MSTSTAKHPAPDHSLFVEVSRFIGAMLATPDGQTPGNGLWKLHGMSAGMNSVNPQLFADRIVQD